MNKLENKKLHLISFDVPFPANYGGVIDVFYKINSLHKIGVKVILHCFQYGREKEYYTIPNNVVRRYMSRQRKNEAIEDLEAAGLLEILEAAPGKNKKVRLNFKND